MDPVDKTQLHAPLKLFTLLVCGLVLLTGCSIAPQHPAVQSMDLPRLLPVRSFVANTDFNGGYLVSPDGTKLVYRGVSRLRDAILWRPLQDKNPAAAYRFRKSSPRPFWAADSRHILYHDDPSGRENLHVYSIDTEDPSRQPRDLTPYENTRAFVAQVPRTASTRIHVMHNRRDKSVFDLYAVDLETHQETLLYENTETVTSLLIDDEGQVQARVRQNDTERLLEVPNESGWRALVTAGLFDELYPIELSSDGKILYLLSNVGRDKLALLSTNLATGTENLLFEHARVDVGDVLLSAVDQRPLIAYSSPDYPELYFFDTEIEKRLAPFYEYGVNGVDITSLDRNESLATAVVYDQRGAEFRLLDLQGGESVLLGQSPSRKHGDVWVKQTPIEVTASDGMRLYGYLSVPEDIGERSLPTVLYVHGGPWARDWWEFDEMRQFLVNRGYAVLQVNYRGSSGYGRDYQFAAVGEFAGRMHQDLIDTVDWAIAEGITDPANVAIMGGSYGGYATLVGITMTPGKFACGIDIVGVSDLATLLEDVPPYWQPYMHMWHRFVGDPDDPEQREIMEQKSPLIYAANARSPLLIVHGVNDPRVGLDQSERMVEALRAADKQIEFVTIGDEGHGFTHWKNQLTLYRKTEDFLARCLGGRSSGFDFYQLGSWAF